MAYASALSRHPLPTHAVGEVAGELLEGIGDRPDAVVVFVTGAFAGALEDIAAVLVEVLSPTALVGCSTAGVFGRSELADGPAVAALALRLREGPAVGTEPNAWTVELDGAGSVDAMVAAHPDAVAGGSLVLLADPGTFRVEPVLDRIAAVAPGLRVVGGVAAAPVRSAGAALVRDGTVGGPGAVGLLLGPRWRVATVASSGCRPVGDAQVVTRSAGQMIGEVAGRPALDWLMAQVDSASAEDRRLMARSLLLGVVRNEAKERFGPDDFDIVRVLGADRDVDAVALDRQVEVGSTVQVQVIGADTAASDLWATLSDLPGAAALLFGGAARSRSFHDHTDSDAAAVGDRLDGAPMAGMLCDTEIASLGGAPRPHQMSAAVALLGDGGR